MKKMCKYFEIHKEDSYCCYPGDKICPKNTNSKCEIVTKKPKGEVVLWEGLVKTGEIGLNLFKGHGEYESTMLFAVDYSKLKGKTGSLVFRPTRGESK